MFFDICILVIFVTLLLGGAVSIFLSVTIGVNYIQFAISFVGILIGIEQVRPGIFGKLGKLPGFPNIPGKLPNLPTNMRHTILRVISITFLVTNIPLEIIILSKSFTPSPAAPNVTIISPADESNVPLNTNVRGTAYNIPADDDLCLFGRPAEVTKIYYPLVCSINISNNRWSADVVVGDENQVGKQFLIIPVLVKENDTEAKDRITKYFDGGRRGEYLGIELSSGMIAILPGVIVTRT